MKWHQLEIKKFIKETLNTSAFAILFLISLSTWHFALGQAFEWQAITPISEPSIFQRLLYSALTFATLGAILYELGFYKFLYQIIGDWQSYKEAKRIIWLLLMGLMFFIIVPFTVSVLNHIISFGYNILNFAIYIFPPLGIAAILAIGYFYFKRTALYQKLRSEDLDVMPSIEDITREGLFRTPQRIKECAVKGIDINKCERDILSKNNNIQKYVYQACKQIQIFGIAYQKFLKEIGSLSKKGHELYNGRGKLDTLFTSTTPSRAVQLTAYEKEMHLEGQGAHCA